MLWKYGCPNLHFRNFTTSGQKIKLWLVDARLEPPSVPPGTYGIRETRVWPTEARQRGCSYKGKFTVRAGYSIDGVNQPIVEKNLGNIPVMLGSDACNLRDFTPAQLVERGEQVCDVLRQFWTNIFYHKNFMLHFLLRNHQFESNSQWINWIGFLGDRVGWLLHHRRSWEDHPYASGK